MNAAQIRARMPKVSPALAGTWPQNGPVPGLRESEMRKKRFGGSPIDSALENESWRPLMARGADHCQEQNAASYRQEPQRQGERQCSDHKAHKGQLGVVARCQMSRRLLN